MIYADIIISVMTLAIKWMNSEVSPFFYCCEKHQQKQHKEMFIGDLYFQGKYNKCLWPLLEDIQSHGEPQDCEKYLFLVVLWLSSSIQL